MIVRLAAQGELRVHGREVEVIVKPRWSDDDLRSAAALTGAPVRITIEPADNAPEEAPHGSALDYLVELKSLMQGALDGYAISEQTERALRRAVNLANTASNAILAERRAAR